MAQISLKLINTSNYGKETEENLTTLYLEQKKREFSHNVFGERGAR